MKEPPIMKKPSLILVFIVFGFVGRVCGQGTFQNLNFESARVVFTQGQLIDTTNALPGWTAWSDSNQLSTISYSTGILSGYPVYLTSSNAAISGSFSVWLEGDAVISQDGVVPEEATSLFFKSYTPPFLAGPVRVSFNGQALPMITISQTSNYRLYGVDVTSFAGQTVTLSFGGRGLLDDVQFSSQQIPEPSAFSLILLGGGAFICARHRKKRLCL